MNIFNKISSHINCGVTTENTKLIDNDFLGLGYQIVECIDCGEQYIVFRYNDIISLEKYTGELHNYLTDILLLKTTYESFISELQKENLIIKSNINDFINYPIGEERDIKIEYIQDLNTGEFIEENIYFTEALDLFPNIKNDL